MFGVAVPAAHAAWLLYERARAISGAATQISSWLSLLLTDVDSEVQMLLNQLIDRVDTCVAPLSFALQWAHQRGSINQAVAFRARAVLQRIEIFIDEINEKRAQVNVLIDRDWFVRQLKYHLSELEFSVSSLSLAMQCIQASQPMKMVTNNPHMLPATNSSSQSIPTSPHSISAPSRSDPSRAEPVNHILRPSTTKQIQSPELSISALLRASERLHSMKDTDGDVAIVYGALLKREIMPLVMNQSNNPSANPSPVPTPSSSQPINPIQIRLSPFVTDDDHFSLNKSDTQLNNQSINRGYQSSPIFSSSSPPLASPNANFSSTVNSESGSDYFSLQQPDLDRLIDGWDQIWPSASLKVIRHANAGLYELVIANNQSTNQSIKFELTDSLDFRLTQRFELTMQSLSDPQRYGETPYQENSSSINTGLNGLLPCFQWNVRIGNTISTQYTLVLDANKLLGDQASVFRPIDFEYLVKFASFENTTRVNHLMSSDEQLWLAFSRSEQSLEEERTIDNLVAQSPIPPPASNVTSQPSCSPIHIRVRSPAPRSSSVDVLDESGLMTGLDTFSISPANSPPPTRTEISFIITDSVMDDYPQSRATAIPLVASFSDLTTEALIRNSSE